MALSWSELICPQLNSSQKPADVWKKDVWDFERLSQKFLELRYSLGNKGKDGKNLSSQSWPWKSQTHFSQTSATTRSRLFRRSGDFDFSLGSERSHKFHREIKGRFRKRVALANVPSFRFSFRGNMRMCPRSGFSFRGNIRTYPRSGFRSEGTSAKTTLLETTLLGSSESLGTRILRRALDYGVCAC